MDRNTVIGFVLLAVLLFAYLFISTKNSHELEVKKKMFDDSVARVDALRKSAIIKADTATAASAPVDTTAFGQAIHGTEQETVVSNNVLKIVFSTKGGQPKRIELSGFQSYDSTPVVLFNSATDRFSYLLKTPDGKQAQVADLYFQPPTVSQGADSTQVVSFQLKGEQGPSLVHTYTIHPNSYLIDFNIQVNNTAQLINQNNFALEWDLEATKKEHDVKYERQQSQIGYLEDGDYDYNNLLSKAEKKFEKPVEWLSLKQQFFNSTLIAKNKFETGDVKWSHLESDSINAVTQMQATLGSKITGTTASIPLQLYFGPNDYKILRNSGVPKMDKIVNLGQGFYTFVRPINQFIIIPVFDFFKKFIGSFGVVIALLTLFIRLFTSPLVYSSYLSGAKMKALRPEIDIIKKKYADDQQTFGMEQMKLFREAGVNPLGGCIPALLQIPIFFALYSFFNGNVALRGHSFLWAKDLSASDVMIHFGFKVPLLGDHLSLFTLLAVATSFLISLYGMANTPDQGNPAMKYMPYIFPFMLLFMFNSLPSALTWYYTVSNVITLLLQFVIQNYIIDHDKILIKLQENRKKPKTKSKWQERLEQMQESQKRIQDVQPKNKGR